MSPRSGRWSGRVESDEPASPEPGRFGLDTATDSSRFPLQSGSRLSQRRLRKLADALSDRDRLVLAELARVRVLTGGQLERLAFGEISGSARGRVRRRVLGRLVQLGLVVTLERRVGGVRAGSAGLVYALSGAGWRVFDLQEHHAGPRRRSPATPGPLFLSHALAVAEVYVAVVEAVATVPGAGLRQFAVEADARWRVAGYGGETVLRPDALVVLGRGDVEDVWWLEVDRGTESLPRLRAKLGEYLAFADAGEAGPGGVVPRVLVSMVDEPRRAAVRGLVRRLPVPAGTLFAVCLKGDVAGLLLHELLADEVREPP